MKKNLRALMVTALAVLTFCVANAASSDVISSVTCSGTTFTIKRTTTTYPTTVYYRTVNGSAVGGIHFQEAYGTINFAAGEATKTVTISTLTVLSSSIYSYGTSGSRFFRLEVWNSCTPSIFTSCTLNSNTIVSKADIFDNEVRKGLGYNESVSSSANYSVSLSTLKSAFSTTRQAYLDALENSSIKYMIRAEIDLFESSGTATGTSWWYVFLHNMTSGVYTKWSSSPGAGRLAANFGHVNPYNVNSRGTYSFPVYGITNSSSMPRTNPWNHGEKDILYAHQYGYEPDAYSCNGNQYLELYNGSEYASVQLLAESIPSGHRYIWCPTIYMCLKDESNPSVKDIQVNTKSTYTSGDKIWISISFDRIVTAKSSSFSIPIKIDGKSCDFTYYSGSGTNTLYFYGTPTLSTSTCVTSSTIGYYNASSYISDWFGHNVYIYEKNIPIKIGQKYTVSYYTNGGTINCGEIKYYTYSVGATLPTNVTRTGYTFGGWYTNSSFTGSPVTTISTTDTGNKTYYAKWTANKYLVTLDNRSANSSGTASVYATYGSLMPTIVPPIKTGYTFGGYFDDTDGQGTQYYYASGSGYRYSYLTAPITLYAKWTIKKPTITFNNQSATTAGTTSATATYGSAMPSIIKPTKTGYTFGGYFTAVNGGGTQYYLASGASAQSCDFETAQTLYAKWTANTYTITFDNQSATSAGTKTATATYDEKLPEIIAPTKTGYTFQGYYLGSNGSSTKYYNADGSANQSLFLRTAATTLYAYWVKDTYTITYVNNGGTVSTTPKTTYQYGDATITLPSISRDGCTFGGWYDNANCEGTAITTIPKGSFGNKTFYAKWTPNTYTVKLNLVGGSIKSGNITSYVYGVGAILPLSSVMTKSGFGFAGWYDNEDYDGDAVSEITIADFGNKEYWAKWEEGSYPVVLNTNEGVVNTGNVVSYKHGTAKKLPTDVTRTGYIFEGWFDNSSCLGTPVTEISAEAVDEKVFWAKWREQVYNVTFETNEGTINNEVVINNYTFSVGGTLPSNVTRNGYSFMGWFDNPDFAGNSVALIRSSDYGDKTFYAKWNKNTYTISYNKNGGYIEDEEIVTSYSIDDEFSLPNDVYKDGYSFYGWFDNPNFDNEPIDYIESGEFGNKTFYAKWIVNSYNVNLVTNGGKINSGNLTQYTYGYGATLPVDITRTGYTFAGWYSDANFTSKNFVSITPDDMEEKTFYAKWTANTYSITLNVNGGTIKSGNIGIYTYGNSTTLPTNIVRDGYTFDGWYENSNYDGAPIKTITSTTTGNKTYYAKWSVNTYSIVLDTDGGQINSGNITSYTYGVGAILPTNVTKTGYTFNGWEATSGNGGSCNVLLNDYGTGKLITVKLVKEMLNIGLKEAKDLVDATEVAPQILEEDITLEEAQIYKDAFEAIDCKVTIEKKSSLEAGTVLTNISTATIGDIELVALWVQNNYAITYNANGGSLSETPTENYVYGDEVTLPTPTREGYTFAGWYNNSNYIGSEVATISSEEFGNKEFWAKWTVNTYNVTLNINEGEINSGNVTNYIYDVVTILPQDVTKTGYNFAGWFDNENCEGTAITQINKGTTDDQEFWAKWTAKTYTVTLQTNNGTINDGNLTSYTYGVGATLPTDITKTGYTFVGWFDNSSYEGGPVTAIANNEVGNKNFWAKWSANEYKVTLDAQGGTVNGGDITNYTYGVTVSLPTNVKRNGYTFTGWYTDAECTSDIVSIISSTTIGEQKYYAGWSTSAYTVTLNTNEGIVVEGNVTSYVHGTSVMLPTAEQMEKVGYTFAGWFDNSSYLGAVQSEVADNAVGDKEFWAKWTVNSYKVTLNTNEGTINNGNVVAYTYSVGATLPIDITKTGNTFAGWFDNAEFEGEAQTAIKADATGDKEFWAKWIVNNYTITYVVGDGKINGTYIDEYQFGQAVTLPTDVTREG